MTLQILNRLSRINLLQASIITVPIFIGLMIGAACLLVPYDMVLFGIIGVAGLFIIAIRPEIGILAIVAITSNLINPDKLPLVKAGPISFHIPDLILVFLLFMVVYKILNSKDTQFIHTPLDTPVILFCIASFISVIIAVLNPSSGINFILRRYRPIMYYWIFFVATNLIVKKRQLFLLIYGLIIIAVLASILMFAQVIFPSMEIIASRSQSLITAGQSFTGIERLYFQGDRIIYVLLLIVLVSFITKANLLPAWLEFGLIGIIGVGEFFTFQRNYWLTIAAMIALLFSLVSQDGRNRFFQWIASCVLLFFIAINIPGFPVHYLDAAVDRITRGIELDTLLQDTSTQYRVNETRYAFRTIQEKPFTGIGLGNYYRPAFPNEAPWNNETNLRWYIHNSYLWVWIDMGLIGIIPFVWFYVAAVIRNLRYWRKVGDSRLRAFVLGSTLGVLGQSISNFVAPNFIQSWVLAIFPLVIGMNEVILRSELHTKDEQ